jgi:hypothetical protein
VRALERGQDAVQKKNQSSDKAEPPSGAGAQPPPYEVTAADLGQACHAEQRECPSNFHPSPPIIKQVYRDRVRSLAVIRYRMIGRGLLAPLGFRRATSRNPAFSNTLGTPG